MQTLLPPKRCWRIGLAGPKPPPPPRPPEEVALEKLGAVKTSGMLERGEIKEFHISVSEAIREYLGGRYGFDSLELTTEELDVPARVAAQRDAERRTRARGRSTAAFGANSAEIEPPAENRPICAREKSKSARFSTTSWRAMNCRTLRSRHG